MGCIGYSQAQFLQLIQISDIISVFGISFLICYFNSVIAHLIITEIKSNKILIHSVVFIILTLLIFLYGFDKIDNYRKLTFSKKIKAAIIQPNFSPYFISWKDRRNEIIPVLIDSLNKIALEQPDIILMSETIIMDDIFQYNSKLEKYEWKDFQWKYLLSRTLQFSKTNLIFGAMTYKILPDGNIQYFNSAFYLNNNIDIIDYYHKIHLVPFGEFIPFSKIFFVKKVCDYFQCGNFTEGNRIITFNDGNIKIAPLICYESIFHSLTRSFAKYNPDLFINITNDAWTESNQAHYQHFYMNVFTSIQNRIPLLRCGNSGISGYINELGEIIFQTLPLISTNVCIPNINVKNGFKGSFYSRYGDIFPKLIIIFFGLIFFISFFFPRKDILY